MVSPATIFGVFSGLTISNGINVQNAPSEMGWQAAMSWDIPYNTQIGTLFSLSLPCVYDFSEGGPVGLFGTDAGKLHQYASCVLTAGKYLSSTSLIQCSVTTVPPSGGISGSVIIPFVFNVGTTYTASDLQCANTYKVGTNSITFYDGHYSLITSTYFYAKALVGDTTQVTSYTRGDNSETGNTDVETVVIPGYCKYGYASLGIGWESPDISLDCTTIKASETTGLNAWGMPLTSSQVGSYVTYTQCSSRAIYMVFENVPAGLIPYISGHGQATTESPELWKAYSCASPPIVTITETWTGSDVETSTINDGEITTLIVNVPIPTVTTTVTWSGTDIEEVTVSTTPGGTATVTVQVPIPTTTLTSTWADSYTDTVTVTAAEGATGSVIIEVPVPTTTFTQTWTGSDIETSTVEADVGETGSVIIEIPVPTTTITRTEYSITETIITTISGYPGESETEVIVEIPYVPVQLFGMFTSVTISNSEGNNSPLDSGWEATLHIEGTYSDSQIGNFFTLELPGVYDFAEIGPVLIVLHGVNKREDDDYPNASCELIAGKYTSANSQLYCTFVHRMENFSYGTDITIPIVFNVGTTDSAIDLQCANMFTEGVNVITFGDGQTEISTQVNFEASQPSVGDSSTYSSYTHGDDSGGDDPVVLTNQIAGYCPNGYTSVSLGWTYEGNPVECSKLDGTVTYGLNPWGMPLSSADTVPLPDSSSMSKSVTCGGFSILITYTDVPAGYTPYISGQARVSDDGSLEFTYEYVCATPTVTETWTGSDVETSTSHDTDGYTTVVVKVPVPTVTTTQTWTGSDIETTTATASPGETALVIVEVPSSSSSSSNSISSSSSNVVSSSSSSLSTSVTFSSNSSTLSSSSVSISSSSITLSSSVLSSSSSSTVLSSTPSSSATSSSALGSSSNTSLSSGSQTNSISSSIDISTSSTSGGSSSTIVISSSSPSSSSSSFSSQRPWNSSSTISSSYSSTSASILASFTSITSSAVGTTTSASGSLTTVTVVVSGVTTTYTTVCPESSFGSSSVSQTSSAATPITVTDASFEKILSASSSSSSIYAGRTSKTDLIISSASRFGTSSIATPVVPHDYTSGTPRGVASAASTVPFAKSSATAKGTEYASTVNEIPSSRGTTTVQVTAIGSGNTATPQVQPTHTPEQSSSLSIASYTISTYQQAAAALSRSNIGFAIVLLVSLFF